jgi:surface antigen
MTTRLIVPAMAVLALALGGCGGGSRPVEAVSVSGPGSVENPSASAAGAAFIGPDGPTADASPQIAHALDTAVKDQPVSWTDADSGDVTRITATRTFQREDNSYCREFTQSVTHHDKTDSARGTACRQADGTWRAMAG